MLKIQKKDVKNIVLKSVQNSKKYVLQMLVLKMLVLKNNPAENTG